MKIIKIELNDENKGILKIGDEKLTSVVLTIKTLFSKKQIAAYPNNFGVCGSTGDILYYIFSDEYGKPFSNKISRQICNLLLIQKVTGKF